MIEFCATLLQIARVQADDRYSIHFWLEELGGERFSIEELASLEVEAFLDKKLLRPVLTNLISNAIKYSPYGGQIQFLCTHSAEEIVFRVQDQGIGIPLDDQSKLFKSFYRASNVERIPGSGLGLSIVKEYVELHGGLIELESYVGQGTAITVTIPLLK